MTKHAIHGMTLTLRHELAPFGIQVTSIIPGGVLTAMSANAHANTRKTWHEQPEALRKIYEPHPGDRKSTRLNPVPNAPLACRLLLDKNNFAHVDESSQLQYQITVNIDVVITQLHR